MSPLITRRPARSSLRRWSCGLLAICTLASACTDSKTPAATPTSAAAPNSLLELSQTPSENNVLSTMLTVTADKAVRVDTVATSPDHTVTIPRTAKAAKTQKVPVVGLRAEHDYDLHVTLTDSSGATVGSGDTTFKTGALPAFIPALSAERHGAGPSAGYTFVEITPQPRPGVADDDPTQTAHVVALDGDGQVVWYYHDALAINDVRLTDQGTILSVAAPFRIRETDLLGDVVASWGVAPKVMPWQTLSTADAKRLDEITATHPQDTAPITISADWIDLRSFHHEVYPMPNGNLLALTTTLHELTAAQRSALCPGDTQPFWVTSDVVAEFQRDGKVLKTWDLFDMVDVMATPGEEMCTTTGKFASSLERDWTHANSVVYDQKRDAIIVSSRHTSQILAMPYGTENGAQHGLRWVIGTHGTIPLQGDVPRYQHAVEVHDDGSILFFDNGNGRPGTAPGSATLPYSRAVRYAIDDSAKDPTAWKATQTWEFRMDETPGVPAYAPFLSDADQLDNANVLVDFGGLGGPQPGAGDYNHCLIVEVAPKADGGDVVWDLRLGTKEHPMICYRTDRVPSLYGGPGWQAAPS